ncbi:dienelactone hydrolase family protein [Aquibium sp. ELW1220]|uniref:alpha/beta hydrolase family protein n=1 Tax=Aquibium sp. ELW1220 TaxID=2976766 RepID=UPI0025B11589|nr:dienelactone hydrolase family protein [Aquibium sp. ELW1220]MDN2583192.1 dienelactone hydrolase family protein [Aquibium sp. ELW1220]
MAGKPFRRQVDRCCAAMAARALAGLVVALLAGCQSIGGMVVHLPESAVTTAGSGAVAIPVAGLSRPLPATLHLPAGTPPFPLAVVSHGSDQRLEVRARMTMPAYPALTEFLVGEGYAVLIPLRPGHGPAGGPYLEDQGGCERADYRASGLETARLIRAAIDHAETLPAVSKNDTLVVGTSAGGWGAIAIASTDPDGIRGYVNFSGGRGGRNRGRPGVNCAPERLVEAAGAFGRSARLPALWLYAENDSYFGPQLSQAMAEAYRGAGGRLTFSLLPGTSGEGHGLINRPAAAWADPLRSFLREIDDSRK